MATKIKTFDWLADIVYPLVLVLLETFWVYPWLAWMGSFPAFGPPRPPLSLVSVFIALGAATLLIRLLLRPGFPVGTVQAAVVGSGLVVILLVLGAEYRSGYSFLSGGWFAYVGLAYGHTFVRANTIIIALPALLYLWWRGTRLGQLTFNFKNVYNTFLIAIAAIIVLIIIWQVSSSSGAIPGPGTDVGFDVIAVFFFGLLAIAIAHLYTMRSSMPREEGGLGSAGRWLPIMLTVIGGMIIVVFAVAGIFSPGFFSAAGHVFSTVWHFFIRVMGYVMIPFNYIVEAIVWVLRWLIARLRTEPPPDNSTDNMSLQNIFGQTLPTELPALLTLVVKWLLIAAVVALVLFILAKAVSRYRARHAGEEIEEIHESLFSWRGLGDDLRELLNAMGKRFQRQHPMAPRRYDDEEPGRLDIREAYRRLLYEASRSGLGRRRQETPEEYSRRTGDIVTAGREPLADLTAMYVKVRYGEVVLPEEKVDSANRLWRILRSLFRAARGQ